MCQEGWKVPSRAGLSSRLPAARYVDQTTSLDERVLLMLEGKREEEKKGNSGGGRPGGLIRGRRENALYLIGQGADIGQGLGCITSRGYVGVIAALPAAQL